MYAAVSAVDVQCDYPIDPSAEIRCVGDGSNRYPAAARAPPQLAVAIDGTKVLQQQSIASRGVPGWEGRHQAVDQSP